MILAGDAVPPQEAEAARSGRPCDGSQVQWGSHLVARPLVVPTDPHEWLFCQMPMMVYAAKTIVALP
jgi:hypothetical protein